MINEPPPSEGGQTFNLAFGIEPLDSPQIGVTAFAAKFHDRVTLSWLFWPDWLIEASGSINDPEVFKAEFHNIIHRYFGEIPDGKLRFNLSGLETTRPNSLTMWELKTISTYYHESATYHKFKNGTQTELKSNEAASRIRDILKPDT